MSAADVRRALVAGAVGRQGEALLNRVLGAGDYADVVALAGAPMALGVRGLSLAAIDDLPPLDDVFILLSDPDDQWSRSYHGRDAAFVQVSADNCLRVAQAAVSAGAARLVLVSPMPAWQQVGHFHRGLANDAELALARLPLASLVVLRPVRESSARGGSLLQRIVAGYLSLQLLMLPKSIEMFTSEKLARCALAAMRQARAGLEVFAADTMGRLLARDT